MVLIDSSVWINYFNGRDTWQTEFLDRMLLQIPLFTGDLILTEVLQGFRKDSEYRKAEEVMNILPCKQLRVCKIITWPFISICANLYEWKQKTR